MKDEHSYAAKYFARLSEKNHTSLAEIAATREAAKYHFKMANQLQEDLRDKVENYSGLHDPETEEDVPLQNKYFRDAARKEAASKKPSKQ